MSIDHTQMITEFNSTGFNKVGEVLMWIANQKRITIVLFL